MARTAALVAALLLAGCGRMSPVAPTPEPEQPVIVATMGINELVATLRADGANVEEPGAFPTSFSFFSVPQVRLRVDDQTLSVFEFGTVAAALVDSRGVSADGFHVGRTAVEWIDQPRFYRRDRLIVLYVGQNAGLIARLNHLLGEAFAGTR